MFWKYDAGPADIVIWWWWLVEGISWKMFPFNREIWSYQDLVDCEGTCQRAKILNASIDLFSLFIVMDCDIISYIGFLFDNFFDVISRVNCDFFRCSMHCQCNGSPWCIPPRWLEQQTGSTPSCGRCWRRWQARSFLRLQRIWPTHVQLGQRSGGWRAALSSQSSQGCP